MLKFPKLASVAITGNKGRTLLIDHSALFQDKIHPIIPRGLGQGVGRRREGGEGLVRGEISRAKLPNRRVPHNRMKQGLSSQRNHRLLALSQCQQVT